MRLRTITRGAFYTNAQQADFEAGNLTLTARDNNWWVYYTDENGDKWKIAPSGTTNETTSPILVDSSVTSIVVTPASGTETVTGNTQQLAVADQDSVDVISECTFASDNTEIVTVDSAGLVTYVGNAGTATVTATYEDGTVDLTDTYDAEFTV